MIGELFLRFDFDFTFLVFLISLGNPKMIIDCNLRFDVAVYRI